MLFKSRQICEALEIGKKGKQQTKLLTQPGHHLKHIKVLMLNVFKGREGQFCLVSALVEIKTINTTSCVQSKEDKLTGRRKEVFPEFLCQNSIIFPIISQ